MKFAVILVALALAASSLSGCMATKTEKGTLFGGAAGATVGALATRSAGGALIGGAVGAATGYLVARNSTRCWKTNIFGQRYRGWCLR